MKKVILIASILFLIVGIGVTQNTGSGSTLGVQFSQFIMDIDVTNSKNKSILLRFKKSIDSLESRIAYLEGNGSVETQINWYETFKRIPNADCYMRHPLGSCMSREIGERFLLDNPGYRPIKTIQIDAISNTPIGMYYTVYKPGEGISRNIKEGNIRVAFNTRAYPGTYSLQTKNPFK